jgi:hypothetical protein
LFTFPIPFINDGLRWYCMCVCVCVCVCVCIPILTAHVAYFSAVAEQWRNCGSVVSKGKGVFSSPKHVGQVWGPPNSCAIDSMGCWVKWLGHEVDHSPPSSAKVKNWVQLYVLSLPSWHAQGHFHLLLVHFCDNCYCESIKL